MSITLTDAATPASQIINNASYVASTNQAEDSTHKNVRVRAEVYIAGERIAVTEQPKALTSFNLSELLRRYITPLKYKGNDYHTPAGTSVLTSWTNSGSFSSFTTSGKEITAAVTTAAGWAVSDGIALTAGEVLAVLIKEQTQNSGDLYVRLHDGSAAVETLLLGNTDLYNTNRILLFVAPEDDTYTVQIGSTGVVDWVGDYEIMKLAATTYGDPLIHYFVKFTEYWENASDVTTAGASARSITAAFINCSTSRDFGDYLIKPLSVGNFLTLAQEEEAAIYVSPNKMPKFDNLITGWANFSNPIDYDTFTSTGTAITSAVTDGSDYAYARSANTFSVKKGQKIVIAVELTLNSGEEPFVYLYSDAIGLSAKSNIVSLADGWNIIELTATATHTDMRVAIGNSATSADWETNIVIVMRESLQVNIVFLSLCHDLQIKHYKNAVATKEAIACYAGWGVIPLKYYNYYGISDNNAIISLLDPDDVVMSNTLYVPLILSCEHRFMEFVNRLGGLDYITFRGYHKTKATPEKEFYRTSGRVRKMLDAKRIIRETLTTRFIDEVMPLVADAIASEYTELDGVEVTVITGEVDTYSENDLIINEIEVEYEG